MATHLIPAGASRTQGLRWFALAGCAAGLVAMLVLRAPAAWVADAVARHSGGHLLLEDARGTAWSGSAQLVLTGGPSSSDRRALPQRLSWSTGIGLGREQGAHLRMALSHPLCIDRELVAALRLLPTPVVFMVEAPGAAPRLTLPASVLAGLGAPWNTLEPQGRLVLHLQRLQLGAPPQDPPAPSVQVRLELIGMGSRITTLPTLGHYTLMLEGDREFRLTLSSDPSSALQLSGQGHWRPGSRVEFRGQASAAEGREAALSNLLNIIGRRDGARSIISMQS